MAKGKLKKYWLEQLALAGHKDLPAADDPNYRYSEITELARQLGMDTNTKLLSDEVRERCRCSKPAVAGAMVCTSHGGSVKRVLAAAKDRMIEMIDPALGRLSKIIKKGRHEPAVVSAIGGLLDRVGLKKTDEMPEDSSYTETDIALLAETLTDDELELYIKVVRKLEAAKAKQDDDDGDMKQLTDGHQQVQIPAKVVNVTPRTMATLIKQEKPAKQQKASQ